MPVTKLDTAIDERVDECESDMVVFDVRVKNQTRVVGLQDGESERQLVVGQKHGDKVQVISSDDVIAINKPSDVKVLDGGLLGIIFRSRERVQEIEVSFGDDEVLSFIVPEADVDDVVSFLEGMIEESVSV